MNPVVTKLAASVAAGAAAVGARKAVEFGWQRVRDEQPPTMRDGDGEGDRQLRDLMLWAAIVTAAVLVARKVAGRATVKMLGDS